MDLKMYTNHVEITDTLVKNKYIKQYLQYFNLDKKPLDPNYSLTFLTGDTIKISPGLLFTYKATGNQYVLTSKDSVQRGDAIPLYLNIFKYNAHYTSAHRPNFPNLFYTKLMAVCYGDTQEMIMPAISYKLSSRTPGIFYTYAGISTNEFDNSVIKNLGIADTLAVQLFNYDFKRNSSSY